LQHVTKRHAQQDWQEAFALLNANSIIALAPSHLSPLPTISIFQQYLKDGISDFGIKY
jgi:hypothetical protein